MVELPDHAHATQYTSTSQQAEGDLSPGSASVTIEGLSLTGFWVYLSMTWQNTSKVAKPRPCSPTDKIACSTAWWSICRFMSPFSFCYDRRTDTCWQSPGWPTLQTLAKTLDHCVLWGQGSFSSSQILFSCAERSYKVIYKICTIRNFPAIQYYSSAWETDKSLF